MNINYAILGSDLNPMFLDFWPLVSKVWKTAFNITPVLGLICDEESDFIQDTYGIVKKFKSVPGVDTGLQSQIVRLFLPNILEGNLIITDIDMLPISTKYFIDDVASLDEDKFYVMSSDNKECFNNKEYPMCYNLGHSSLFREILNMPSSWYKFVHQINALNLGWSTDQLVLFKSVNDYESKNPGKVVLRSRGWSQSGIAKKRIDRIAWSYDPSLVKQRDYIDCHMLRPYKTYEDEINKLAAYLLSQK